MASIDRRPNGTYRARWREQANGRQRSKTFARKVDAETFLTGIRHQLLTGSYVAPEAGRITVAAYSTQWKTSQPWRPASRVRAEATLKNHVLPRFGRQELRNVRTSDVRAWVAKCRRTAWRRRRSPRRTKRSGQ